VLVIALLDAPGTDCIEHFRVCKVLTAAAERSKLIVGLDQSWYSHYLSSTFGRSHCLSRLPALRAKQRTREMVRWVAAIYDCHNMLRHSRRPKSQPEITAMLRRTFYDQSVHIEASARRRAAVRSRRAQGNVTTDVDPSSSSSDDGSSFLAIAPPPPLVVLPQGLPGALVFQMAPD
jgi:hypothetical protein